MEGANDCRCVVGDLGVFGVLLSNAFYKFGEESLYVRFRQPSFCDPQCQVFNLRVPGGQFLSVYEQEELSCSQSHPLVPIDKGMIGTEMKVIGRRLVRKSGVQVRPAKGGSCHRNSRRKKISIAEPRASSELFNDAAMDQYHVRDGQVLNGGHYCARRRSTSLRLLMT